MKNPWQKKASVFFTFERGRIIKHDSNIDWLIRLRNADAETLEGYTAFGADPAVTQDEPEPESDQPF